MHIHSTQHQVLACYDLLLWSFWLVDYILFLGETEWCDITTSITVRTVIAAFGSAMSRLASTDVIAVYFDKHKDKIFAASATSGLAGAMVAPVTLEYLYLTVSYKYTLLVLAATAALNLVPVLVYKDIRSCCLRSRSQESEDSEKWTDQNTSNDINNDELKTSQLYENGDDKLEEVKWIDERVEGETEREDEEGDLPTIKLHLQFLRQPAFLLVLGSCMLTTLGQNSFVSLAADYMIRKGVLTAQQAALGMSILGGATIVGSLMLTLASHWPLDRVLVTVVSSFTLGLIIVFTPLCKGITSAYPLLFAFGVFDSIALANVVSLISHEFGSDGHLMAKVSYMFMSMGMGSVIGPVIAGYLTTLTDGDIALYFLGSMSMCGAAILISYWLYKRFRGQPPNPSH